MSFIKKVYATFVTPTKKVTHGSLQVPSKKVLLESLEHVFRRIDWESPTLYQDAVCDLREQFGFGLTMSLRKIVEERMDQVHSGSASMYMQSNSDQHEQCGAKWGSSESPPGQPSSKKRKTTSAGRCSDTEDDLSGEEDVDGQIVNERVFNNESHGDGDTDTSDDGSDAKADSEDEGKGADAESASDHDGVHDDEMSAAESDAVAQEGFAGAAPVARETNASDEGDTSDDGSDAKADSDSDEGKGADAESAYDHDGVHDDERLAAESDAVSQEGFARAAPVAREAFVQANPPDQQRAPKPRAKRKTGRLGGHNNRVPFTQDESKAIWEGLEQVPAHLYRWRDILNLPALTGRFHVKRTGNDLSHRYRNMRDHARWAEKKEALAQVDQLRENKMD